MQITLPTTMDGIMVLSPRKKARIDPATLATEVLFKRNAIFNFDAKP